jgi:hypothetical protein
MNEQLLIIAPELPPTVGGVADYTSKFVAEWPAISGLKFIVPKPIGVTTNSFLSYPVEAVPADAQALLNALPAVGGKIFLQYSAYGFDPRGYPQWLLGALTEWKQRARGLLVIMFHEIWTFVPLWNKNCVRQRLHRRALARLVAVADLVFTTTDSQARHLSELHSGVAVEVLPVGSNITPALQKNSNRQPGTAVLFGVQSARIRTLESMHRDLAAVAQSDRLSKIICVGAGNSIAAQKRERHLLSGLRLRQGYEQLGALSEQEVSTILTSSEGGISAQDKLSYAKSGTFMAYAAHGLRILSKHADRSQGEPMSLLVSPAELAGGIAEAELRNRGERLREWYQRTASWQRIAERFSAALRLSEAQKPMSPRK